MRFWLRFVAALVATAIAVAIGAAVSIWDIATDQTGEAVDAAAKGAAGLVVLIPLLLAFYFAVGGLRVISHGRPYWNVLAVTAVGVAVLAFIPTAVYAVVARAPGAVLWFLPGVFFGFLWLCPGALVQARILRMAATPPHNETSTGRP